MNLKNLSSYALALGIAALASAPGAVAAPAESDTAASEKPGFVATADELFSFDLINRERRERGLAALEFDPLLAQVAREHSADMAKRAYFDHIEPEPTKRSPMDRYADALGETPQVIVGENIARCSQPLMGFIHLQLTDSRSHLSNILGKEYVRVGVGVYTAPDGRVWLTQMYCGKKAHTRQRASEG